MISDAVLFRLRRSKAHVDSSFLGTSQMGTSQQPRGAADLCPPPSVQMRDPHATMVTMGFNTQVVYPLVIKRICGKSPSLMGKSTISLVIFYSYVNLLEGIDLDDLGFPNL